MFPDFNRRKKCICQWEGHALFFRSFGTDCHLMVTFLCEIFHPYAYWVIQLKYIRNTVDWKSHDINMLPVCIYFGRYWNILSTGKVLLVTPMLILGYSVNFLVCLTCICVNICLFWNFCIVWCVLYMYSLFPGTSSSLLLHTTTAMSTLRHA